MRAIAGGALLILAACRAPSVTNGVRLERDTVPRFFLAAPVRTGHEFAAAESPDRRIRVLSRRTYASPTAEPVLQLVETRRTAGGEWTTPVPVPFTTSTASDIDPIWAPDGSQLLFNSTRASPGRAADAADFDIWAVPFRDGQWGEPARLPAPLNTTGQETYASMARNGTIYFSFNGPGSRETRVMRSRPVSAGQWSAPETLTVVNDSAGAGNPFIAADESFLLFVSRRAGGAGDSDLYVSERRGATWAPPRALRVNTARGEFAPAISADGAHLLFARLRRGDPGEPPIAEDNVFVVSRAWALGER
jgi:hypothetical protein